MLFAGLIFSRSRMGIIASAASILVFFGVASLQRKTGLLLSGVFIVLSVALAGWIGARSVVGRFENVSREYTVKNESRLSIWQGAGTLIRNHPWLGAGLGTFPIVYTEVQATFLTQFVNHAHNDYLEIASDLGIPAALCLFISILFVLARAFRDFFRKESRFERAVALGCAGSIVAILLHSLADFNLHIPANALVFSVVLGVAMSRSRENRNQGSVEVAA
jgi:O-antigen ligase